MPSVIDIAKKRFGRLIVLGRADNDCSGDVYWLCKCDCGKQTIVRSRSLRNSDTRSCGCLRKEIALTILTHGHTKNKKSSRTYNSWNTMVQRCTNPVNTHYHSYGGRGIVVCNRWMKFESFLEDMGERPIGCQIDRIDNDGNYCLSNCSWVIPRVNSRNKRNNYLITHNDKTQCLSAWAEEYGINCKTLFSRIRRGWSVDKALTNPVRKRLKSKIVGCQNG